MTTSTLAPTFISPAIEAIPPVESAPTRRGAAAVVAYVVRTGIFVSMFVPMIPSSGSRAPRGDFMPFVDDSPDTLITRLVLYASVGLFVSLVVRKTPRLGPWLTAFMAANALVLGYMLCVDLDYVRTGIFTIYVGLNLLFVFLPFAAGLRLISETTAVRRALDRRTRLVSRASAEDRSSMTIVASS